MDAMCLDDVFFTTRSGLLVEPLLMRKTALHQDSVSGLYALCILGGLVPRFGGKPLRVPMVCVPLVRGIDLRVSLPESYLDDEPARCGFRLRFVNLPADYTRIDLHYVYHPSLRAAC